MKATTILLISLVLFASACTPVQAQDAGVDLANSKWQLVSFGEPEAEMPVIERSTITLEFDDQNRFGGSGGCNSYGGSYVVEEFKLKFGEIITTLIACTDQAIDDQEGRYLGALRSAGRYTGNDSSLTIWYNDEKGVLNFVRASTPSTIPTPAEPPETVNFTTGAISAQRSGTLPSGPAQKQYALAGNAGQTLTVEINDAEVPIAISFTTPSGKTGYHSGHKLMFDETGIYLVTLSKTGETPSTAYTVVFTIQ